MAIPYPVSEAVSWEFERCEMLGISRRWKYASTIRNYYRREGKLDLDFMNHVRRYGERGEDRQTSDVFRSGGGDR